MALGRKTGGRKAGSRNRATLEREARARAGVAAALAGGGPLPLDIILAVARGGPAADAVTDRQLQAAIAAAPYLHPRLASTTAHVALRADPAALSDAELAAIAGSGGGRTPPPTDDPP
jgi:hypothetical protein